MRILLADDDTIFRSLMVDILESGGHTVLEAENGLVAWESLQAEGADLAVLDINMPEMDGVELLSLIRADERFRGLPVIVLTIGFVAEELVQQYDPSVTDHLTKPFDTGDLLAKVQEMERRTIEKPAAGN